MARETQVARTPPTPDAHLARYRATGDVQALGALFDATAPVLFRVALSLTGDAPSAEDALQQTYLAVLTHLDRHDPSRPVTPWLVGILQREVLMARRRRLRKPDPARMPLPVAPPPASFERTEDDARIRAAIEALDEPYRGVALLRWRYGLEPAEIAHVRGEPPGTTRSLLSRAKDRLRRTIRVLPAAIVGVAAARGLAEVRRHILARAAGSTAAKTMVAALTATALLGAGGWWFATTSDGEGGGGGGASVASIAPPDGLFGISRGATLAVAMPGPGGGAPNAPAAPSAPLRATGRVVDRKGNAVVGARVVVYAAGTADAALFDAKGGAPPGTDAEGRFDVACPEGAARLNLAVTAPGFAPAVVADIRTGAAATIVLGRSGSLAGHVTDMEGRSVAGARVRWLGWFEGGAGVVREAVSGRDGAYRVEGIVPLQSPTGAGSGAHVEVVADGFAPLFLDARSLAAPGSDEDRDLVLVRGATLAGRVVDGEGGAPVADARVVLWSTEGAQERWPAGGRSSDPFTPRALAEARSGSDGRFRIEHVPARGFHRGQGDSKRVGFVGAIVPGRAGPPVEVLLGGDGATVDVELNVGATGTLAGRIVDQDGAPLAGQTAWADDQGLPSWASWPKFYADAPVIDAQSDADGRFRLTGVRPVYPPPLNAGVHVMRVWPIAIKGPGKRAALRAGETADLGTFVLRSDAVATASARIVVVDEAGLPVDDAEVKGATVEHTDAAGAAKLSWSGGFSGRATDVVVRAPGFATSTVAVALKAGDLGEIRVVLRRGRRLEGRVLDAARRPAAGVRIEVADGALPLDEAFPPPTAVMLPDGRTLRRVVGRSPSRMLAGTRAEDDGTFRFEELPPGPWHVAAIASAAPEGRSIVSGVASDSTGVELILPADPRGPRSVLFVHATDAETGHPLAAAAAVLSASDDWIPATMPGLGRLRFDGVPEGLFTLHVEAVGYIRATVERVDVRPGAPPAPISVALTRGADAASK